MFILTCDLLTSDNTAMRRIQIFVSSPEDVQKEQSLADQLIRSIAAEFNVPVSVSYSNRLRTLSSEDKALVEHVRGREEGALFWEYPDSRPENSSREHLPGTGQYDLVVCILWSRLGTKLGPAFVLPGGAEPRSATDYEIAWALDQAKLTPGFPTLHVYQNRSTPRAPLEPKQERERFFTQSNQVQEFFADWQKESAFSAACADYRDLVEFEELFSKRFRDFLDRQLEELGVLYLRNRLDKRLKLWLALGRRPDDLLDAATGLGDAESLLRDFRSSLNTTQIKYVQKSLAKQKLRRWSGNTVRWMAVGSFVILAAGAAQWWVTELGRKKADAGPALSQFGVLEPQLKQAEGRAQFAEKRADLAASQLKKAEEKAQVTQKDADEAASRRSALEADLKKAQEALKVAQKSGDAAGDQRSALETELKKALEEVQTAQKNADLAASQRSALEAELKKSQETAQTAHKNADLTASQRRLRKAEEKAQTAQKNAELAVSQRDAFQTQLKDANARAQQIQNSLELVINQREALQSQLKDNEANAQQAQKEVELVTSQRDALQNQLNELTQKNAELPASQRDAFQTQLKDANARAQQIQNSLELVTSQRDALQAQLKETESRPLRAEKNTDAMAIEHDAQQMQSSGQQRRSYFSK